MGIEIASLIPEVRIDATAAPDPLIEQKLRDAAIEMCRDTWVWQHTLPARSVVAGRAEHTVSPPDSGSRIVSVLWMRHNGELVTPASAAELNRVSLKWHEQKGKQATRFVPSSPTTFRLAPIPTESAARGLTDIRVALMPVHDATELPDILVDEFREAVVSGALYRLLRMPGRDWTQGDLAAVHLETFNEGMSRAKTRVAEGWSAAQTTVHIARFPGMP